MSGVTTSTRPTPAPQRRGRSLAVAWLVGVPTILGAGRLEALGFVESGLFGLAFLGLLLVGLGMLLLGIRKGRRDLVALALAGAVLAAASLFVARAVHRRQVEASKRRGDLVHAALLAYHARSGRYPEVLAQLVPHDLPTVPTTAMGCCRSRPFAYDKHEPDGFVLRFEDVDFTGWAREPTGGWVWYD